MKHPNREQWIGFLYEDCEAAEKNELAAHLESCAECQKQIQTWRKTMSALNQYRVVAKAPSGWERPGITALRRAWLPLSAAAAMILAAGVMLGFAAQSRTDNSQTQIIAELRARVEKSEAENARTQKLLVELSQTTADNRAAVIATAQQLKSTRKDLETVAALTQHEFVRLASYTP